MINDDSCQHDFLSLLFYKKSCRKNTFFHHHIITHSTFSISFHRSLSQNRPIRFTRILKKSTIRLTRIQIFLPIRIIFLYTFAAF